MEAENGGLRNIGWWEISGNGGGECSRQALSRSWENVGDEDDGGCPMKMDAPAVGMVFSTLEELYSYYREYGKQEGFGVVCEAYGTTKYESVVNGKRVTVSHDHLVKRKFKKCECHVVLYASMTEFGEWRVVNVNNSHNHTMEPKESNHIAMYKKDKINKAVEKRIDNDYGAGSSIPAIYNNMAH
uniref:FAR1 domain-containing protein n=1 Tax=Chenopodium quinoa TaxID=63459 RepID=A0A803LLU0_CHEQI